MRNRPIRLNGSAMFMPEPMLIAGFSPQGRRSNSVNVLSPYSIPGHTPEEFPFSRKKERCSPATPCSGFPWLGICPEAITARLSAHCGLYLFHAIPPVYPGQGDETTIGFERKHNEFMAGEHVRFPENRIHHLS